jgi:group I intron endonuclease
MPSSIPQTSGVYKIVCIPTGKIYIGSAINLHKRRREHWADLRAFRHRNRRLQNAWNKYGETEFKFEVIELVLASFILEREQFWMDKLRASDRHKGFNLHPTAGSAYGFRRSEESKQKNRLAALKQQVTDETRRQHSVRQKDMWQSPIYRKRMSLAHSKKWIVTDPDGHEYKIVNLTQFCRERGLSDKIMSTVACGRSRTRSYRGWKCRHASDEA